jgi:hypothetical protein
VLVVLLVQVVFFASADLELILLRRQFESNDAVFFGTVGDGEGHLDLVRFGLEELKRFDKE